MSSTDKQTKDKKKEEEEEEEEEEEQIEKKEIPKAQNQKVKKVEKEKVEKKNEEEEEEGEVEEVDEEIEEEVDEEEEDKNDNEEKAISIQNTKNGLQISMELIKLFKEISQEESEDKICEFIKGKGLPMIVNNEETLVLILYFHKLCVPFYKILLSLQKKDISKIFLSSLKESYYLFADSQCKHFNYKSIAKNVFSNLKKSDEKSLISIELISAPLSEPLNPTPAVITISQKILELGLESQGKLDVYSKIHILKALINSVNLEKLKPYTKDFQQMEKDLINLYNNAQKVKMTEEKYNEYVKIFTDGEKRDEWPKILSSCKKAISIFQNLNDTNSIKIYEKFFIQLLGHIDREIRNEAVKVLNIIYDQTTWQEKSPFPLDNTKIQILGEELKIELRIENESYSEKSIVLVVSSPSMNKNINYTVTTFLKCEEEEDEDNSKKLKFNLGKLSKCGYYDWYLVRFSKGRFSNIKILKGKKKIDGKGRSIVLNKDIKNLSVHEVFPDLINAEIDKNQGKIIKRGNFKSFDLPFQRASSHRIAAAPR